MATPFPFTAGQVLTAAQMNAITELIINDKTDSYTLVAGDAGEYVVMNKSTATTITVPNNVFSASQIVRIVNKGAGVCTITAGAGTTVSTTGTLALAQNAVGTLIALSASAFIYEAGGVTATPSALTLVTSQTFSAAATVSMASGTFTSTYQNYLVLFQTSASSATQNISMRVNNAGTARTANNYYGSKSYSVTGGTTETVGSEGVSSINVAAATTTNNAFLALQVFDPLSTTVKTSVTGTLSTMSASGNNFGIGTTGGVYNVAEANDGLTFFVTGTITGNYRVYGYSNS